MESDDWEIERLLHESSVADGGDGLYVCEGGRYNTENDQHQSKIQGLKFREVPSSEFLPALLTFKCSAVVLA